MGSERRVKPPRDPRLTGYGRGMSEAVTAPHLTTAPRLPVSQPPVSQQGVIPEVPGDQSVAFLSDGYLFGHRRFEQLNTDAFRTRLMGRRVTMLRGHAAARFFSEEDHLTRAGTMPKSVLHSLQDEHDAALADAFAQEWDVAQEVWADGPVSLLAVSAQVLTDATLRWLGIPESFARRRDLAHETTAMIDGAGSFGPRNWHGRMLRRTSERWARDVVRRFRDAGVPVGSPLAVLLEDSELTDEAAAVELLNLVRTIVVVSRFIAFGALALHQHPLWRDRIRDDDGAVRPFSHEVRRTTPFSPAIAGQATARLQWRDVHLRPGDRVMLDHFATNRHPGEWTNAWNFDPSRFERDSDSEERIVAPGEPATIDLLDVAVKRMAKADWTVPDQSFRVDLGRLPAVPGKRGMLIRVGRD